MHTEDSPSKRQKVMALIPTATYQAPDIPHREFHPGDGPHTTSGTTTQISDHVINAGGEDRDKPTPHKDTPMGNLRAQLTTLQDQLNVFLTERMKLDKQGKSNEQELERKILDEAEDEEED